MVTSTARSSTAEMCDGSADVPGAAAPRPAPGAAVDPITLEPVDELLITTLVDNVYDALLPGDERTRRAPFSAGTAVAPQFEDGRTAVGLVAEHGVRRARHRSPRGHHDVVAVRHRPLAGRDGHQRRSARR